jgi:hypothetical protein
MGRREAPLTLIRRFAKSNFSRSSKKKNEENESKNSHAPKGN